MSLPLSLSLFLRIINGEEACPHCWPWQCRGAILSPTWILTAAHCVQSKNNPLFWIIVAGDHDRTLKEPTEQVRNVRRAKHIMVHEDFDGQSCASDIALIQLSSPLEFNSAVRPVCLPQSMELLLSSEICAVTGWGSILFSKTVQEVVMVSLPLISSTSCRSYWGLDIKNTNICGGAAGSPSCMGDSGGPLQCAHDGQYKLIGIVSWGSSNCLPAAPTVFARISAYRGWITSVTGGEA
ncbi:unnamed protein product [Nyctereutes procyonoides]|uniref:(raccoon dog) hypothetical protein n=1 Tax=Nyctereutes procyonoides TaxID=34880 RepID=A0A811Y9M4_NYCPR|nr:unnamed protein product [Nyctereutes procyonoides]